MKNDLSIPIVWPFHDIGVNHSGVETMQRAVGWGFHPTAATNELKRVAHCSRAWRGGTPPYDCSLGSESNA